MRPIPDSEIRTLGPVLYEEKSFDMNSKSEIFAFMSNGWNFSKRALWSLRVEMGSLLVGLGSCESESQDYGPMD